MPESVSNCKDLLQWVGGEHQHLMLNVSTGTDRGHKVLSLHCRDYLRIGCCIRIHSWLGKYSIQEHSWTIP